jgi:hypothetical protein
MPKVGGRTSSLNPVFRLDHVELLTFEILPSPYQDVQASEPIAKYFEVSRHCAAPSRKQEGAQDVCALGLESLESLMSPRTKPCDVVISGSKVNILL